jgi:hypothetical protein
MSYVMKADELAMVKAHTERLNSGAQTEVIAAVQAELDALLAQGIQPTRNHVRAACTRQMINK